MNRIKILDENTSNQIAAGEVVERPHSVVKELIENSLDAGATQIEVSIQNGGAKSIIVKDNGFGMSGEDAVLCFSRYATSKLKSASDLNRIHSFGFRGEALASIASVSRIKLKTRQKQDELGQLIVLEAGSIKLVEETGCPVGTQIEVSDLFYNVPARLKFLKSSRSETSTIEQTIRSACLAKKQVGFLFRADNKVRLETRSSTESYALEHPRNLERAIATMGENCRTYLYPFKAQTDLLKLEGYVTAPLVTRRDSRGIQLFVNERPVEDKQLVQAVRVAFRSLLEIGRFPICAINIQIDPEKVDVNVHPRKSEVRFLESSRVQSHLIRTLSDFLAETPWAQASASASAQTVETKGFEANRNTEPSALNFKPQYQPEGLEKNSSLYKTAPHTSLSTQEQTQAKQNKLQTYPSLDGHIRYAELKVVGQVDGTFLLLEGEKSMVVLDQHAAHERVVFQRIKDRLKDKNLASQRLLFPVQIPLLPEQILALQDFSDSLTRYGFEVNVFGDKQAIIKSIPADFRAQSAAEVVRDVLDDLAKHERTDSLDEVTDHLCAQIACHSSIRAGQNMQKQEIEALLLDLDSIEYGAHCPHGRPVMRAIPFGEMAKWFHRS